MTNDSSVPLAYTQCPPIRLVDRRGVEQLPPLGYEPGVLSRYIIRLGGGAKDVVVRRQLRIRLATRDWPDPPMKASHV